MNRPGKRETSLCERDALADMRAQERTLLRAYADAAGEGERSLREAYAAFFAETAEDAYSLFTAAEGETVREESERLPQVRERFSRVKKQMKERMENS